MSSSAEYRTQQMMMAPPPPVPATNRRLHKRDNYDGPNLAVLIPVIVILTLIAVVFFGWLGVPWPRIMAWWKRKRTRTAATPKEDHHDHDQELQHQSPSGRAEPQPQPQPGSRLSYAKAFERSHIDALKLPSVGADPKPKTAKEPSELRSNVDRVLEGEEANRPPARASAEARPSGSLTPDLATGQMTPGQQSTLSAVPERRASPWDPTRNPH
ncbi:hypothetical protein MAC_01836 [Metarhizium acridum CQMa 102]|uniref:Uncharacterized protein n=1 Tax=Metarhizium acridum (strain CQMa 102) TaxID=655827 RepID=E9DW38_METAQ|nr:uncharacterized protein MAC_01836 [Metarhizium acridum CQMa 102]EFY92235.1 hypothetical protein MAC_01836 [Metarhizium acridum CQMa 102]